MTEMPPTPASTPDPEPHPVPKHDLSVSLAAANVRSLIFAIPAVIFLGVPYLVLWGWPVMRSTAWETLSFLGLLLAGVVAHESIHGLTWVLLGTGSFSTIRFGINWKLLTPYAHAIVPMKASAYRWGAAMPAAVLGLLPALAGLVTGSGLAMAFGLVFIVAACGDFLILWLMRSVSASALVEDHPTRAGCLVHEPEGQ